MDPALMCTSTGYGEQTISKIYNYGERRREFVLVIEKNHMGLSSLMWFS
jgi:hypothetical protein